MCDMLANAGFVDIRIQVKENAADIVKDWMPGSGAEKYVSSAYVTARKPSDGRCIRDDVRANPMERVEVVSKTVTGGPVEAGC